MKAVGLTQYLPIEKEDSLQDLETPKPQNPKTPKYLI